MGSKDIETTEKEIHTYIVLEIAGVYRSKGQATAIHEINKMEGQSFVQQCIWTHSTISHVIHFDTRAG